MSSTSSPNQSAAVKYYDLNWLGANTPSEDRYAQAKHLHADVYLFGVFDGHGGYSCSDSVTQRLFDYIALHFLSTQQLEEKLKWNVAQTASSSTQDMPIQQQPTPTTPYPLWHSFSSPVNDLRSDKLRSMHDQSLQHYTEDLLRDRIMEESIGNDLSPVDIEVVLRKSFLRLDHDLRIEALPNPASGKQLDKETMDVAMSGSCACVALLNGNDLYVANSGDARAIIGQERDDEPGTYAPRLMSHDHNADNENELKRLLRDHPNEQKTLIRDGRLLEMLLPLRAFGDVRFKWGKNVLKEYTVPIYGHGVVPAHYFTPPYVTAEPEVLKKRLNYKDKFMVLATDGLWDMLTPERVVQLVGNHLKGEQSFDPYLLPEEPNERMIKLKTLLEDLTKRRVSISLQPVDHNSATHLIRYALGNDHMQISNYLCAETPRTIRDDITITVVYFDTDHIISTHN